MLEQKLELDPQPALKLLDNARSYSEAAKSITTQPKNRRKCEQTHLSQSAAIYAGLALDCYLKTLYFLEHKEEYSEKGKTPHDFHTMYQSLNHKTQKNLEALFTKLLSKRDMKDILTFETTEKTQIPRDLKGIIKVWTNTFTHLRVNPIDFNEKHMLFFHEMEDVFKSLIFKEKPEWANQTTREKHTSQYGW